jgi:hypothetical protein
MSDYKLGFVLDTGFIDHFNTQLATKPNYNAIAYFHTLQFTKAQSLVFSVCY